MSADHSEKVGIRIDSTFLNETIVRRPHSVKVEFTILVPFERLVASKGPVEGGKRWHRPAVGPDRLAIRRKTKSWNARYRFIFIGKQIKHQHKLPIQSTPMPAV